MNRTDLARYPAGRTRLEPLGVIVFATMMGMATLQLLSESIKGLLGEPNVPLMTPVNIGILLSTIALKFGLFVLCSHILVTPPNIHRPIFVLLLFRFRTRVRVLMHLFCIIADGDIVISSIPSTESNYGLICISRGTT